MAEISFPVFHILMGVCLQKSNSYCSFSVVSGENIQYGSRLLSQCRMLCGANLIQTFNYGSVMVEFAFSLSCLLMLCPNLDFHSGSLSLGAKLLDLFLKQTRSRIHCIDSCPNRCGAMAGIRLVGSSRVGCWFMFPTTHFFNSLLILRNVCIIF